MLPTVAAGLLLWSLAPISRADTPPQWNSIPPGTPAYGAAKLAVIEHGRPVATVQLAEPMVVAVASKPEEWGFFQFPKIGRTTDGALRVGWSMHADSIKSYGKGGGGAAISNDEGKSWVISEQPVRAIEGVLLPNGDRIAVVGPKALKVEELAGMPKPVGESVQNWSKAKRLFYRHSEMPLGRQGVFIKRLRKGETEWVTEHAVLDDPKALRYSLDGLVPIVWSGNMHLAADGSIIAGIYPGFEMKDDGTIDPKEGIYFYRSTDEGRTWKIQGRIPYQPDLAADPKGKEREGFMEPAFEILPNGTYLCIMRTSDVGNGPMYIAHSKDHGMTWTQPKVFTPSGVFPQLLQLQNGVIVLASGRPGVQLRFSTDGQGATWTDPLELFPYYNADQHTSCGYTSLLATGPDRFLMVYSDFRFLNEAKETRKAIKIREVIVTPK